MLARMKFGPNPIVVKEVRSRMRGWRAFLTLTAILLSLGGVSYLLFQIVQSTMQYSSAPLSPQIGQAMFAGLAFFVLIMVCAVTPAVTAGAISSEKEKLTYEMLVATPLRPTSILIGKLVASMGYVFLLIFAAVPMFSLVFTFGGVAVREMFKAVVVLMIVAVMLGVLGLFLSALFGRSGRATVAGFLLTALLLFLPYFLYIAVGILRQSEPPRALLAMSPISAMFSALAPSLTAQGSTSIFWLLSGGMFWGNPWGDAISQTSIPRPLYHYSVPIYGAITLILFLLSTRLVQPARRWKLKPRQLMVGVGTLLVYFSLIAAFFVLTANRYEFSGVGMAQPVLFARGEAPPVQVQVERVVIEPQLAPDQDLGGSISSEEVTTSEMTEQPPAFPPPVQSEIYAEIIRRLYEVDHTFGQPPNFPVLYLAVMTDDTAGDPNISALAEQLIPKDVMAMVTERLSDLPAEFRLVDRLSDVPVEPDNGSVIDGGAAITLGNIQPQGDGTVYVAGSLTVGPLIAGGRTYILANIDGRWTIIGVAPVEWQR
jgi:ABC-2 type transport system permease protein